MRDYLVFFRAGPGSLHPRIIGEDPKRNWDCCVGWWCSPLDEEIAEFYFSEGENKLDAFRRFYGENSTRLPYKYFLLLDDDLDFKPGDISRFFDLCEKHQLYLAAPALAWGTNVNHDVTLWNPVCNVRQVTYVEVMAPCFSKHALSSLLDTFLLTKSLWGIDYAWSSLLAGQGRIATVDAIQIEHTKAPDLGGGTFYRHLMQMGADPAEEYGKIKCQYPSFGGFRTARRGHFYRFGLPDWLGWPLTRLMEHLNKRIHRRFEKSQSQK